jgi:threonine/homoserine/homoserine lactone efflux protein
MPQVTPERRNDNAEAASSRHGRPAVGPTIRYGVRTPQCQLSSLVSVHAAGSASLIAQHPTVTHSEAAGRPDAGLGKKRLSFYNLLALSTFAFVTSLTPGPSNLMLLASGANFGFIRTVPQVLGITIGFTSILLSVGLGLGAALTAFPGAHVALKLAGGVYLLRLAWRIAMSRSLRDGGDEHGRPLTLLESAAFQWVNPKAWVVALATVATYADPSSPFVSIGMIALAFALVNLPTVSAWAGFGMGPRGFLSNMTRLKWFNVTMAILLAASLWPMLK